MSASDTKRLIAQALEHLRDELPALRKLQLVIKLELRDARGDVPIWRVELPGPKIDRDPAADARIDISVRAAALQRAGRRRTARGLGPSLRAGRRQGHRRQGRLSLLGNVIQRRRARV